jgi:hypothetical protein
MRRWFFWILLLLSAGGLLAVPGGNRVPVRVADGFDMPVGKPNADGYYMSRGSCPTTLERIGTAWRVETAILERRFIALEMDM